MELEYESAKEWYDSLGYYAEDNRGVQYEHPICSPDDLDLDDEEIIVQSDTPREAAFQLIAYARKAWSTAQSIEAALASAVEAVGENDYDEVEKQLKLASYLEFDYGDDPAASYLRTQIIEFIGIDNEEIDDLRTQAGMHGDLEQVAICDLALENNLAARAECARVCADALAAID